MSNRRILQLCADDFGLSAGVDLAILDLIARGRLSATSCMMAGPTLGTHAPALLALADRADIGLHLTFTDLAPLGPMPDLAPAGAPPALGRLVRRALLRQLDPREIKAEILRQIQHFRDQFGRAPDFVDGHQHAHVLPVIRAQLWACYRESALPPTTAIRNCREPLRAILARGIEVPKSLFIAGLSAGVAAEAARIGVPTNDSFRGITAFATDRPFGDTFVAFLSGPGQRPLAMCHPGLPGHAAHPSDAIPVARTLEYAYFAGDGFPADLARAGLTIGRHPRG